MLKQTGTEPKDRWQALSMTAWLCLITLLAATLLAAPARSTTSSSQPRKYAILIGINKYEGSHFKSLKGALNDVELIRQVLIHRFEMDPVNITVLLDEDATHDAIKTQFEALAERLKPGDMVYIHYSGHGSYTRDMNGDEAPSWGKDSTWVTFGARSKASGSGSDCAGFQAGNGASRDMAPGSTDLPGDLNEYDILDDEIHGWLASLCQKTDQVIFVSDSCHSGTVTRGDTFMARGVPLDSRPHPLGTVPAVTVPITGPRVSACRDDEEAVEYKPGNRIHGLFTWFWAKSLDEAQPGETWLDVFRRTHVRMQQAKGMCQRPRIEGDHRKPVFDGRFAERPRTAVVTFVSFRKDQAKIDEGQLLGVTVGSIYRKYAPGTDVSELPTLEITETAATWSRGSVTGGLKIGDRMELIRYQQTEDHLRVLIRPDLDQDEPLSDKLKKAVIILPAFVTVTDPKNCDLILQILRPRQDPEGAYLYESDRHSLPRSFPREHPECWILTPEEILYHDNLRIPMTDQKKGVEKVCEYLSRIGRIRNLTTLSAAPGANCPLELSVTIRGEVPTGTPGDVIEVPIDGNPVFWKKEATVIAENLREYDIRVGQLLTFAIRNRSERPYYSYLIDITPDGDIKPFYPPPFQRMEAGLIHPASGPNEIQSKLLIDKPGREYIRLIASIEPIDIYLLEEQGFQKAKQRGGKMSPLEALLTQKAGKLRSSSPPPIATGDWGTVQVTFHVNP